MSLIRRIWPEHLHRADLLFIGLAIAAFVIISTCRFFSMNDQLENIFGGTLITQGVFPYSGFFTQHMPLPHFLGAGLSLLTQNIWWLYHACFVTFLGIWLVWLYGRLSRWTNALIARAWVAFVVMGASLTLSYTFLAETFVAFAGITLLTLFLFRYLVPGFKPRARDAALVSVLTFLIVGSSLLYIFFAFLFVVVWFWIYLRATSMNARWRSTAKLLGIFGVPYIILAFVMFATRSTPQFVFDVYTFNREYYAQFVDYPQNVVSWLAVVPLNFFKHVLSTLSHAGQFLRWPDLLCTFGMLGAFVVFLRKRQYLRGAIFLASVSLLVPRNDFEIALNSLTDTFHSAPYFFVAALGIAIVLSELRQHRRTQASRLGAAAWTGGTAIVLSMLLYWSWSFLKFCQAYPDIRVRPQFAAVANSLLSPDDYYWSGPAIYPDILQVKARFASHALHYFPWQEACESCTQEFLAELNRNQPKLIVFEKRGLIWQYETQVYAQSFLDYLNTRYYQLPGPYGPYGYLYFRKDVDKKFVQGVVAQAAAELPLDTIFN